MIEQCFGHTNRVCQNPDSVVLEYNKLRDEFQRISKVIEEEVGE